MSVVIPTYNYGRYVVEAVESVLAQTYRDFEVIVVDDGSRDDTRERLAPFTDRIRYILQENQGLSAARNRGITEAKGEFIALLDADDLWHPRFLETVMGLFEGHSEYALIGTDVMRGEECHWEPLSDRAHGVVDVRIESLLTRHPIRPSAVVIRREMLSRAGPFDTELRSVEDRDMWLRLACVGRIGFCAARLGFLRSHPTSMSAPANAGRMEHFDRIVVERALRRDPLRGRWRLRREALSAISFTAAIGYREAGTLRHAWKCILRGIWQWPFGYREMHGRGRWYRSRFVASLLREQIRAWLRPSEPSAGP